MKNKDLTLSIIGTEERKDRKGSKTYTVYVIEIREGSKAPRVVFRRYSEFLGLVKTVH